MRPPSSLVISQGWGLSDLPLRASNEGLLRPRVARAQKIIRLHPLLCSGSTGPTWVSLQSFLSWGLCEQEERSACSFASFLGRALREHKGESGCPASLVLSGPRLVFRVTRL
jgi:hypothetical protein